LFLLHLKRRLALASRSRLTTGIGQIQKIAPDADKWEVRELVRNLEVVVGVVVDEAWGEK
jgi:hypothetical protein